MQQILFYITTIVCFFELIILYRIMTKKTPAIGFADFIFILVSSSVILILNYYELIIFKTFYAIFSIIVLNYKIFRDDLKRSIFYSIIIWVIGLLLDLVMAFFTTIIFEKFLNNYIINKV